MANLDSLLIPGSPRRPVLLDITPRIITAAGITNITDTFARGSYGALDGSATSDGKTTWDADATISTSSPGQIRLTALDADGSAVITDDLASSDMAVTIEVTLEDGDDFGEWSVWARLEDASNLYAGGVYFNGAEWEMYLAKIVADVYTAIDTPVEIGATTPPPGTTFTLTCDGTSISLEWSGGAETLSATDGDLTDGKKAGLYGYVFAGTPPAITNFEAATL